MARIVLGSYLVRYPLGGMMSWVLQYLVGFSQLGHEVYFVEKSGYPNACFDPLRKSMTDDCRFGTRTVNELLTLHGLGDRWCFVDQQNVYHGLPRPAIEDVVATADLFIDMGTHGSWREEASPAGLNVLLDGEPAFTQLKMEQKAARGQQSDDYNAYYTTGRNIGTSDSTAPTGGREWRHLFHPISTQLIEPTPLPDRGRYTTVMNWQSYEPVEFNGIRYCHKDVEFEKFINLPANVEVPLEVAVSGAVPRERLIAAGWRLRSAHEVTQTFVSFFDYIRASRGEFGVCKSGYVVSNSGWFSDRSAAYLAAGRPVVLQETGFSRHLPTGRGLFAVSNADEAAAALEHIEAAPSRHARWAREIAEEFLDTAVVLGKFLEELGIPAPPPVSFAGVKG
jgi:hypothetical protein